MNGTISTKQTKYKWHRSESNIQSLQFDSLL